MNKHEPLPASSPDFFYGCRFAVDEIVMATNLLAEKVKSLKQGNESKSGVQQKLAAEECAKIAGQIKMLSDLLARLSVEYANRRPRP